MVYGVIELVASLEVEIDANFSLLKKPPGPSSASFLIEFKSVRSLGGFARSIARLPVLAKPPILCHTLFGDIEKTNCIYWNFQIYVIAVVA